MVVPRAAWGRRDVPRSASGKPGARLTSPFDAGRFRLKGPSPTWSEAWRLPCLAQCAAEPARDLDGERNATAMIEGISAHVTT